MSYQVLARKWRPQNFEAMVGQQHVLRALTTALTEERLHHAYLFTGTRGVGKTTIARIFAKSLNCEQGISASPCGECRSCLEIAEGRHVDLIEVDAASRTKVEDTRELLDNVQYAPTRGRFKIYLIDEVHMLSGHSFNALLKTLEEPPPHVKFLFATTDPQKLPVTILSRCLQFNLKRMSQERIVDYLQHILAEEQINFEEPALQLLARSADGSMRDALSLTDQAIVTGQGQVTEVPIRDMLGMLPQGLLAELLQAIAHDEAQRAFDLIEQLADLSTDFTQATENLISALHQIAVAQVLPQQSNNELSNLIETLAPADVQLYYQMALHGRRDLALALDARSGFEMLILRMLAFSLDNEQPTESAKKKIIKPASEKITQKSSETKHSEPQKQLQPIDNKVTQSIISQTEKIEPVQPQVPEPTKPKTQPQVIPTKPAPLKPKLDIEQHISSDEDPIDDYAAYAAMQDSWSSPLSEPESLPTPSLAQPPTPKLSIKPVESACKESKPSADDTSELVQEKVEPESNLAQILQSPILEVASQEDNAWHALVPQLGLTGMAQQVAQDCLLESHQEQDIVLALDSAAFGIKTAAIEQAIQEALSQHFGSDMKVSYIEAEDNAETPARRKTRIGKEQQIAAEQAIQQDPLVQKMCEVFDATLVKGSIRPHTN